MAGKSYRNGMTILGFSKLFGYEEESRKWLENKQ